MILALSILAGATVAALLFRAFFDDWNGFWNCVRFWLTPDIFSLFRGEWVEDRWAEVKLAVYVSLSVGSGWLAYAKLRDLFG